jgi:Tfp pilus assembly protein PilW
MVELVVAMGLLSLILTMAMGFFASALRQGSDLEERTHLQGESRLALDVFAKDIRQANSGAGTAPIEAVTATSLTFLSPDYAQPFHMRRISYRMTGTDLERSVTTSTDTDGDPWSYPAATGAYVTILKNVRNSVVFEYFDAAGTATTSLPAIRTVKLSVGVDPNATSNPGSETYSVTANLRAWR